MTERRTSRRYDLALSATVRVPSGSDGVEHSGQTRNISTRGVYMVLAQPVGQEIEVDLKMNLSTGSSGTSCVYVRATGRVVRVEEFAHDRNRRVGVAATFRRYEIVRTEFSRAATRAL